MAARSTFFGITRLMVQRSRVESIFLNDVKERNKWHGPSEGANDLETKRIKKKKRNKRTKTRNDCPLTRVRFINEFSCLSRNVLFYRNDEFVEKEDKSEDKRETI